jgi:predicted unusual protein kinase regulating ubiquinone biosynthesis (AarF/ABC1/UbiB family)
MKAVMPNTGYVIDMPALMSDIAGGVSAKFLSKGKNKKEVLKIFEKIPSDAILKAAIFDLLVGNCDRHTDNVFIDENGRLTLIDNDMVRRRQSVVYRV